METLFEQYKNLAYAIVHRNFKYYSEKDDLIQIALIALWDASNTFNPAFNVGFMCYASVFICNKIKDYIRRQKKHHLIDLAEDVELGNYEINFSKLEFDVATRNLSLVDKQILQDVVYGFTQKEIAAKYGMSQATISRKLRKIKGKLK